MIRRLLSTAVRAPEPPQPSWNKRRKLGPTMCAGVVSPPRPVPPHIRLPPLKTGGNEKATSSSYANHEGKIEIKNQGEMASMRAAGRLARRILDLAGSLAQPGASRPFSLCPLYRRIGDAFLMATLGWYGFGLGTTTDAIDAVVHDATIAAGAYPSPLGYRGFPKSVSTSVNEVLFHGIPDDRPLENGDIVNIDVTVYLDGHHGDCSRTFLVGDVDLDARRLVEANEECLSQVISQLRPGMDLRFIGEFIEDYANRTGFNIFPDLAGHGIGREFHAYPPILHFHILPPFLLASTSSFWLCCP